MAESVDDRGASTSRNDTPNNARDSQNKSNGTTTVGASKRSMPSTPTANVEDLTTRALRFFSTASNQTLGIIALSLAFCTHLMLGRLGLVLLGVLGGVVLHSTWEGQSALAGKAEDARKEKSLDVASRILDWRADQIKDREKEEADRVDDLMLGSRGFEDFRSETATALRAFVDAVVRDYVRWWYTPIVPTDDSFPAACRMVLTKFLRSISVHLSRKRPADTFVDFLTNSSSIFIVFLSELSSALSASQIATGSAAEAVDEYLMTNPDSNLANILNEKQQSKKFKAIADDILQNFLDKATLECTPVRLFLKQILGSVVMEMSLNACSKPEWINGWIVYLLEEGEPDLLQAIDVGMGNSSSDSIDGKMTNSSSTKYRQSEEKRHRKRLSRAEEAMEEAMEEAKRLSQLIAEEDNRKVGKQEAPNVTSLSSTTPDAVAGASVDMNPNQRLHKKVKDSDTKFAKDGIVPAVQSAEARSSGKQSTFTSFDQIVPPSQLISSQPETEAQGAPKPLPLSLHNANVIMIDDSTASDKGRIRTKPSGEYLVQVEPRQQSGWITVRKFQDFETLHEVLRRIASVAGVTAFTEQHGTLPDWRTHTKASLRGELERYLRDACWHQQLAESEGMKRFLEKDQGNAQSSNSKGIGWPTPAAFETMGKGMLDVLSNAPKGAAEGGKAVFEGVTGVFGTIGSLGQKKKETANNPGTPPAHRHSTSNFRRSDSPGSLNGFRWGMDSEESLKASPVVDTQPSRVPPMERKPSYTTTTETENDTEVPGKRRVSLSSRSSMSGRFSTSNSRTPSRAPSVSAHMSSSTLNVDLENINLPPPPSDIPDDYGSNTEVSSMNHSRTDSTAATVRTSTSTAPSLQSPRRPSISKTAEKPLLPKRSQREPTPLSEQETRVAVELLFAIINELYTLSSAWNFRRTLLTAAKTYLLRPGNPSLASIQSLIQDSIIVSNTSDAGIAEHLRKLRANTMPTEEELKAWPPELTGDEKEKLRVKARKLLVEKGMPAALTGVMGQVATGEALGKVFDCLQVEEVARGLMFGLLLQGIRAMTH